ncbi:sugar nucleotide-binding protein [Pseudobutyrivibrio sp. MD2005]|uniref:sugar nucleotide-binding protein n=1 Tax=Pseudobutyrivibrio sp. MD2005 TaxID=1410616 RepID=UPI000489DFE0|nr:sugar nucleotide-binding protein [Pseudobutyrivibrio sp. MD2005]
MVSLVGYTGFVGSNIYAAGKDKIDAVYNSKNIEKAFGTNPDLLIYAGLRAEKYLANNAPEKDMELIVQAEENITKINPKNLVLISTIDVFKNPIDVDENTSIDTENLHAYGLNRYKLELWVRERYPEAVIIRLPGLFGQNIKKNFIYDYINVIPFMLKEEKFQELVGINPELKNYYVDQGNGFYKVNVSEDEKQKLKDIFNQLGFSAINFTDSRGVYQFYNLARLWDDIQVCLANNIKLWHPATEPVSASEVYRYLTGKDFNNELNGSAARYDYKTIYDKAFSGENGYILGKEIVLKEIEEFVRKNEK